MSAAGVIRRIKIQREVGSLRMKGEGKEKEESKWIVSNVSNLM